jgi:glucose-1-phosphate cytidylyltransferase
MKAIILAGGLGTRISEETLLRPKPMIEIGGKPILWHIMKLFTYHNINEFIICLGYKGYYIKEYFANYYLHMSDVTFDMRNNEMEVHSNHCEPWKVTLLDTGLDTMTGGRLKRIASHLDEGPFFFTYGDGVADVDLHSLIDFHRAGGRIATMTAIQPPGRYGALNIEGDLIRQFQEKPKGDGAWVNGGFFVLEPEVINYIQNDSTIWEREPLERLAAEGQLCAYKHRGFWQAMDTMRDKIKLEELWNTGKAPWKVWDKEIDFAIDEISAKAKMSYQLY